MIRLIFKQMYHVDVCRHNKENSGLALLSIIQLHQLTLPFQLLEYQMVWGVCRFDILGKLVSVHHPQVMCKIPIYTMYKKTSNLVENGFHYAISDCFRLDNDGKEYSAPSQLSK